MGSSWVDFLCAAFGSQESLVGEMEGSKKPQRKCKHEQKGPFGKGVLSRGGEGFESRFYCYSVLHTREEFPLF